MSGEKEEKVVIWPAFIIGVIAVGIWGGVAWLLYCQLGSQLTTIEAFGQFGDSFGGLNSLFTMLAFVVIAGSLYLQRRELQATLNEIRVSSKAQQDLANAAKAERRSRADELGLTFFSAQFREVRGSAWALRNAMWRDADSMGRVDGSLLSTLAKSWIDNDHDSFLKAAEPHKLPADCDRALSQIVEFFVFLADYFHDTEDADLCARLNYFRYPFWRGILIELNTVCTQCYEKELTAQQRKVFPLPAWLTKLKDLEAKFARHHPYVRADDPVG